MNKEKLGNLGMFIVAIIFSISIIILNLEEGSVLYWIFVLLVCGFIILTLIIIILILNKPKREKKK